MSDWDVSHITNMEKLFYKKWHFNADLSKWDTSHVTNMKKMFCAFEFSQDCPIGKVKRRRTSKTTCLRRLEIPSKLCLQRQRDWAGENVHLARRKEHTNKQPQTLVSEDEEEEAAEEAEAEMHKHDLVKLTTKLCTLPSPSV